MAIEKEREGNWWEAHNPDAPWQELYNKYPDTDWNKLYSQLPEGMLGTKEINRRVEKE